MTDPRPRPAETWGGCPIVYRLADAARRCRVVVTGVVRSARVERWKGVRTLVCVLDDGTATIELRFMGRTSVPAVRPGSRCRVEGTVIEEHCQRFLWDPHVHGVDGAGGPP